MPECTRTKVLHSQKFDRWLGQYLSETQKAKFRTYYEATPSKERPLWAIGLNWWLKGGSPEEHADLPWDFGLFADYWPTQEYVTADDELWKSLLQRLK